MDSTWAWAGKAAQCSRPPGLKLGPVDLRRLFSFDGHAVISGEQNPTRRRLLPNPRSFDSLPLLSLLARRVAERSGHRVSERREPQRVSTPPSSGLAAAP